MKATLAILLVGVCAFAAAQNYNNQKIEDNDVVKQEKIFNLFKYVRQADHTQQQTNKFETLRQLKENVADYTNSHAIKQFMKNVQKGMLLRGEIFSVFNPIHLKEAITLFKVLQSAKDFKTFHETALWARNNVNQGMFLYSVSVAILHRDDTKNMILPAIYEIYPHYFVNTHTIQKAQQYKQEQLNGMTVRANHSGSHINVHPEQSLSYFTEDVGINAFYYRQNLNRPFWMDADEFNMNTVARGEEYYYLHQQLLARYYLERLSNDMGDINTINYDQPIETGYTPSLHYPCGTEFPERPNYAKLWEVNDDQISAFNGKYVQSHTLVKDLQRRIRDVIDSGIILGEKGQSIELFTVDGFNKLGNLIESNPQSENNEFYGNLQMIVRQLLGFAQQPLSQYKLIPSALEHFETSLRDPAFWQMYKKIVLYFQHYNQHVPKYTHNELNFEGVKIESVEVDDLITTFEDFDFDITNGVYLSQQEMKTDSFQVTARQARLTHKPFTYKINVASDKATQAVVRVFLGPKYDEYDREIHIDENRVNFVELDQFVHELTVGQNVIERNSQQTLYCKEKTTIEQLHKYINQGQDAQIHDSDVQYTFPTRYLLPKGQEQGKTYQLYVIINQHQQNNNQQQETFKYVQGQQTLEHQQHKHLVGLGVQQVDARPLGYPFDKPIDTTVFHVSNAHTKNVKIYHIYNVEDITSYTKGQEYNFFTKQQNRNEF